MVEIIVLSGAGSQSPNIFGEMAGTDRGQGGLPFKAVPFFVVVFFFFFFSGEIGGRKKKKNMSEVHRCELNMRPLSSAKRIRFLF